MNYRSLYLVILAFLLAIASAAQTSQREEKALRIIHQNIQDFSNNLVQGNYEAVVAAYLPDGKIFPNNRPILGGREAISEYWTPKAGVSGKTAYHKIVPEEIKIEGQTAYDWGYYYGRTRQTDGFEIPWQGKYLIVWKEVAPDIWKIYLDIWNNAPRKDSPYQSTEKPALLGIGTISTELPEFASTFSRDGNTIWFNRTTENRSRIDLFESRFEDGSWTAPRVPFFADTMFRNIDPWAISTQNLVLFSSNRPLPGSNSSDYNLWQADLELKEINPLPASVNSPEGEVYCSVSRSGNLYFARFSGKTAKIYLSARENGICQTATLLAIPVPDSASISNPAISPDENYLVFASGDLGGFGQADLFVSRRQLNGTWSVPQNLGAGINTSNNDFAPAFSLNGETLFYTSEQPGIVQNFPAGERWPGDMYHIKWDPQGADEKAIRAMQQQYADAWLQGDAAGVLSLFTPDARITPNDMNGIDSLHNIRAFWFPEDGSKTIISKFENQVNDIKIDGDWAFSAQKTTLEWSYSKGSTQMGKLQYGYAHTVYQRQKDGSWKIRRHAWTNLSSISK